MLRNNTQAIQAFMERLDREDVMMHGFQLSCEGEMLAKVYYAPFREGDMHRMYSVSKTMTGIAVGMLAEDGALGLDQSICDFFPDWVDEGTDERLRRLTIRNMLRMATCHRRTAYREGTDENWARQFFLVTPSHESGTVFHYDTGCSQVLAELVRRLSGKQVLEFLEERLFTPLGATDEKQWLRDPSGCCQGGTGLLMSLRDLHKVAECILRGGDGLIPGWFTQEMGEKKIDTLLQTNEEEKYGYGWQCWRTRAGFAMYGLGGQLAVICPEKKVVLTTIADTRLDPVGVQRIYNAFFEEVYPFISRRDADGCLIETRQTVALSDAPGMEGHGKGIQTGKYTFEEGNPLGLRSLAVDGDCLVYENARGQVRLPFGRGKNLEISYPGWDEVPALCSGGWVREDLLRVRCFAVGKAPCGFDMQVHIHDHAMTVQSRKSFDSVTEGYDGVATGY
ncbi:MAG: serine hydrolase [Clostridia bacterium]|nr:serine hydrolase [Clostridia bacterium]